MLDHFRTALKINMLAVEYPGYGIYIEDELEGKDGPTEEKIYRDARLVLDFVTSQTHLSLDDIVVLGRSLGSGPATYLASNLKVAGLVLMSPYTSIRNVAFSKVGFLSYLLSDQFNNLEKIRNVTCPTFIVHGQKDTLIPVSQA